MRAALILSLLFMAACSNDAATDAALDGEYHYDIERYFAYISRVADEPYPDTVYRELGQTASNDRLIVSGTTIKLINNGRVLEGTFSRHAEHLHVKYLFKGLTLEDSYLLMPDGSIQTQIGHTFAKHQ